MQFNRLYQIPVCKNKTFYFEDTNPLISILPVSYHQDRRTVIRLVPEPYLPIASGLALP